MPTRLSRWTMSYFAFALAGLLAAELALAAGLFDPLVPESPTSLVVVHLTVLGSLLPLVFGALNQFAPVLSARPLASEALSLATLVLLGPGVAGLVAGFALLAAGAGAGPWLPGGGLLVVTAVALEAGNVLATLLARRPLPFPARFVAAALVFAVLTVLLGLTMALVLAGVPLLPPGLAARALALLPLHLAAGLFGFFGLTAVGVGYKLLPMFSLAPEERGVLGEVVFFAEVGGVAVGFGLGLAALLAPGVPALAEGARLAFALAFLGVFVYLFDMARLIRDRRRRHLELNMRFAAVALAALGVSALLGAAGLLRPSLVQAALYLFVYGWLGLLGLSQLYKIVPFLTWIERFGSRLGRARDLPRVQDLVDEPRDRPWFLLYAASAALGAIAVATGSEPLLRLAGTGGACAVLGVARALRHARVGSPVASPSPIGRPARR